MQLFYLILIESCLNYAFLAQAQAAQTHLYYADNQKRL